MIPGTDSEMEQMKLSVPEEHKIPLANKLIDRIKSGKLKQKVNEKSIIFLGSKQNQTLKAATPTPNIQLHRVKSLKL